MDSAKQIAATERVRSLERNIAAKITAKNDTGKNRDINDNNTTVEPVPIRPTNTSPTVAIQPRQKSSSSILHDGWVWNTDEIIGFGVGWDFSKVSPTSLTMKMLYRSVSFGFDIGLRNMLDTISVGTNNWSTNTSAVTKLYNTTQYGFNLGVAYQYINLSIHFGLLKGDVAKLVIQRVYTGTDYIPNYTNYNFSGHIGYILTPMVDIYLPIPWTYGHIRLMLSAGYNFAHFTDELLNDIDESKLNGFRYGIGIAFFNYN